MDGGDGMVIEERAVGWMIGDGGDDGPRRGR